MAAAMLPPQFAEFEPFAPIWCLATEPERYARRLATTLLEQEALYNAVFPRVEEACAHLDQYPLDELPEAELNLLRLLYSLVMISVGVETWRSNRIPDTGASMIDCLIEPGP